MTTRTYAQFCPVAAGMDILGDRWVLLILRELMYRDRRFTDLRQALPGLAPNLLTDRLRSLTKRGLIARSDDDAAYAVTSAGRRAQPILGAYARFGAEHLDFEHFNPEGYDARRTAQAFLLPWQSRQSGTLHVRLITPYADGQSEIDLLLGGKTTTMAAPEGDPTVIVRVTTRALARSRQSGIRLAAEVHGPAEAIRAFYSAFALTP